MRPHHTVRWLTYAISILSILLITHAAEAARVAKVKGKKVLIALDGEPAERGDIYYLLGPSGRKRALIKIMKVKGNKALAVLGKGRARPGMTLQARGGGSSKSGSGYAGGSSSRKSKDGKFSMNNAYWGFMLSFDQDAMDVTLNPDTNSAETVSLSGSSLSYKGLFDYRLFEKIWFRGFFGMDTLSAEGPDKCGSGQTDTCYVDITYLTFDFWGRYILSQGTWRPWVGAGFDVLIPMSNDVTALEPESVTNTVVMAAGGGIDYFMSESLYFPLQIEYGIFPSSDQVSASLISVRGGVGFSF